VEEWLKTHGPNDRTLAQGLKVSHPPPRHRRRRLQAGMPVVLVLMLTAGVFVCAAARAG